MLINTLSILAIAGMIFGGVFMLPGAIDKEMKFNESIRQDRCSKVYLAGYCEGL